MKSSCYSLLCSSTYHHIQDVTNRANTNDFSKDCKPKAHKRGTNGNVRIVPLKRDKRVAVLKLETESRDEPLKDTLKPGRDVLALKSLKEISGEVTNAIYAEAEKKPSILATQIGSADELLDPFKNVTQTPEKYVLLDLEKPAPAQVDGERPDKESTYQYSANFHDIDNRDADDELCVTEYVEDIYEYFRNEEHRSTVDPQYMNFQREITTKMRSILVDWLALVSYRSKLSPEVLYLTVSILDRYLEKKKATKKNLQLIGTATLFIASKYEDIYHIEVDKLVYLCDRAYSAEQIYEMEHKILKTLNYQISLPSTYRFLLRFLNAGHADKKMVYLSCYILELTMLNIKFIEYLPSELAAAAVFIARKTIGRNGWSPTLLKYVQYTEDEIVSVARDIVEAIGNVAPDLTSIRNRYLSDKKMRVALLKLPQDL